MVKVANEIKTVFNLVKNKGYDIYLVGGYVRDYLLNKESYDVDMTTNATPDILKVIFKDYKLNEEFIKFGCIKFKINNYCFEITTFRKESEYRDHRKPNKVEYTSSLKEDLIRRDFTINALCFDLEKMVDLFNGKEDLNNKIIRTIGEPNIRFEEDALRILRALRFSSKLGFKIERETRLAIKKNCKYLKEIPIISIRKELVGILNGKFYLDVLKNYKKELMDIFSLTQLKLDLFKKEMSEEEKEALFFYYSENNINNKYLINKEIIFINDKKDLKYKLKKYGYERIYDILYFRSKYLNIDKDVFELLNKIIDDEECYNLKTLKINGDDLLELDIKGDKIGKHLNILLEAVIENKCLNVKKELIRYLKNNIIE